MTTAEWIAIFLYAGGVYLIYEDLTFIRYLGRKVGGETKNNTDLKHPALMALTWPLAIVVSIIMDLYIKFFYEKDESEG